MSSLFARQETKDRTFTASVAAGSLLFFANYPDLWECYTVGPESSPDSADWRTELNRPLCA